jgi:hypothetical protein
MESAANQTGKGQPARPRRRMLRYSLRTLLVAMTMLCVVLGLWVNGAERQRRAVAAIQAAGGYVFYDYERPDAAPIVGQLPGPDWLCERLGVDYFADVTYAYLSRRATDETVAHLRSLTSLEELLLYGTPVSDVGLAHLSGLSRLEHLSLFGTQVTDVGVANLSGLTNLERLSLFGTQVTDAGVANLSGLTRLEELSLDGTQVTDVGLTHLVRLTSLKELSLIGTQVTDAGLAHLTGLTSLEALFLLGTKASDTGCARLQQSLPNCEIIH